MVNEFIAHLQRLCSFVLPELQHDLIGPSNALNNRVKLKIECGCVIQLREVVVMVVVVSALSIRALDIRSVGEER